MYSCIEINRTSTVPHSCAVRGARSLLPRELVRPLNHLVEDGPKIAKVRRAGSEPEDRAHRANGKERRRVRPVGSVDQKKRIMRLIKETANSIAVATSVGEPKAVTSFPPGPHGDMVRVMAAGQGRPAEELAAPDDEEFGDFSLGVCERWCDPRLLIGTARKGAQIVSDDRIARSKPFENGDELAGRAIWLFVAMLQRGRRVIRFSIPPLARRRVGRYKPRLIAAGLTRACLAAHNQRPRKDAKCPR